MRPRSLLGFLLGIVLAGSTVYSSMLDEYRVSNQLLSEDVIVRRLLRAPPCAALMGC